MGKLKKQAAKLLFQNSGFRHSSKRTKINFILAFQILIDELFRKLDKLVFAAKKGFALAKKKRAKLLV